jgi:hypothetical protein
MMSRKKKTIEERVAAGEFRVTPLQGRPVYPLMPAILDQSVGDLTDDEIRGIPAIRAAHVAAKADYEKRLNAYSHLCVDASRDVDARFLREVCLELLLPPDHPFVVKMFAILEPAGFVGNFMRRFEQLRAMLPLWEEAKKMVEGVREEQREELARLAPGNVRHGERR